MSPPTPIPPSFEFEEIARGAHFRDRIAIRVKASPEAIFRALEAAPLSNKKLAWVLGEIRYVPLQRGGHLPVTDSKRPRLSSLKCGSMLVLRDDTPREIIVGSAARLRRLVDQTPVWFSNRDEFDAFDHPEHQKLFMSVRVAPTGRPGEHWLVLEHATRALSPAAERKFKRYWQVIKPMGAFVSRELLRAVGVQARRAATRESSSPGETATSVLLT